MMYLKRNLAGSLEESVLLNTGLSREELYAPESKPFIYNLQEAASLFQDNKGLPITIVGDYDADGICGTAILYHACRFLGITPVLRLPKRLSEGYGLSVKIIDEIPTPGLVITVDNGIAALDAIAKAKEKGLKVIVIDHHEPVMEDGKAVLPCADVVVDPKADSVSAYRGYCGAGLACRFAEEVTGRESMALLILASIATVADIMPLTGANRMLVRRGIAALNKGYGVPGLKALAATNKQFGHFDEGNYGFWFGPIFNANGRLEDNGAAKVLRLLTMDYGDAKMSACVRKVLHMNEQRKELAKEQTMFAEMLLEDMDGNVERPIVVSDPIFEPGIVGIIAGRLSEKHQCPVLVFSERDGIMKGSGRSIPEVNLKSVLDSLDSNLMLGYGGHSGAAGVSIRAEDFGKFRDAFKKSVGTLPEKNTDVMYYDIDIRREEVSSIADAQKALAPFGEGNPKPVLRMIVDTGQYTYARIGDGSSFSLKEKGRDIGFSIIGFDMSREYESLKPKTMECLGMVNENWYDDKLSYQFELVSFKSV